MRVIAVLSPRHISQTDYVMLCAQKSKKLAFFFLFFGFIWRCQSWHKRAHKAKMKVFTLDVDKKLQKRSEKPPQSEDHDLTWLQPVLSEQ